MDGHVVFVVVDSLYTVKFSIQFYIDLYVPLFTLEVFVILFKEEKDVFQVDSSVPLYQFTTFLSHNCFS